MYARSSQGAFVHPILSDIRLVVFDLDGTLVDSVPDLAAAVDAVLVELGLAPAGQARVRDWVGNGARVLMERALGAALDEAPAPALLERAHAAFLAHYGRDPSSRTRLYSGVREGVLGLRDAGLVLGLVTNKPAAFIEPVLAGVGLSGCFRLCLGGDSLPRKKPDPAPLRHVAAHFGLPPSACLMVGDSRHDIVAGRAAGFRTLAVPYGYNHGEPVRESGPDGVVESLRELV
jgi:phosphoglycolate phosphatase